MDQRGVVLEIEGEEAIVLTPSGEFRRQRISYPKPEIGDEISLTCGKKTLAQAKGRWASTPWHWMTTAVAAVVLLMVNLTGFGGLGGQPIDKPAPDGEAGTVQLATDDAPAPDGLAVRFVSVDINPSIELALNEKNRVIEARPLNDDGKELIPAETLKGLDAEEAISRITDEAVHQGYLSPTRDNAVVIAVAGEDRPSTDEERLEARLRDSALTVLSKGKSSPQRVQVVRATADARKKAQQLGLSVGKYAVYLEALDRGLAVRVADLKKTSITKVISAAGGNPLDVLQGAAQKKDLAGKEARHQDQIREDLHEAAAQPASSPAGGLAPLAGASQPPSAAQGAETGAVNEPVEVPPSHQEKAQPTSQQPPSDRETIPSNQETPPTEPAQTPPKVSMPLPTEEGTVPLPDVPAETPSPPPPSPSTAAGSPVDDKHAANPIGMPSESPAEPLRQPGPSHSGSS
ncbi:anti-sigma factor domain-containing protein [Heliobacterium gestii]|uniref:Anti-sigma factor domain-containing protein n=1 Tax=Heliomicrobium gestii TaxID=2699 RepID=A0A845LJ26_HELGE|nr:anti-sigma factor domain-containing protein [Heliomicrobium gestii]MBM7868064.1 hypothetical protein [Heliomicrobium gestii]MZP44405.1 anti-sigma factor domain-containing protein [Heliomicrobium gestii]